MISVEIVYALPERQRMITLQVEDDCTVLAAAQRSGIAQEFEIDWSAAVLGIFGKIIEQPAQTSLREGDRIEIYRPLIADPKTARRQRARHQQKNN
jgi:putative ubiquitin-RnfH superfamily antitoxin RatB of RatAB toxin-antitoxin module